MTISLRVREVAEKRGMNIRQLANAAGISYDTALDVWHGRQRRIDLPMLAGLCKALQCTPGDLLEYLELKDKDERHTLRLAVA